MGTGQSYRRELHMYAHLGMDLKITPDHIPGQSGQPPKVPEALFVRGGQCWSADYHKCSTSPEMYFYVKIGYSEQLLTSLETTFVNTKLPVQYFIHYKVKCGNVTFNNKKLPDHVNNVILL